MHSAVLLHARAGYDLDNKVRIHYLIQVILTAMQLVMTVLT